MMIKESVRAGVPLLAAVGTVAALAVAAPVAGASIRPASLPAGCAQPTVGGAVTCTYGYTGAEQTFMVPAGVSSVDLSAVGAAGGNQGDGAGPGGTASLSSVAVTAGETLYMEVGGVGGNGGHGASSAGGFNGGGAGGPGVDDDGNPYPGSGGGGASDVRTIASGQAGTLDSRLLVAAGGGGGCPDSTGGGPGQAGGAFYNGAVGGGGATTTAGGAGGPGAGSGTLGVGGAGSNEIANSGACGGGGGYYGGGGGSGFSGSGGGGSNYAPGGTTGTASGAAQVTVSYTPVGPATALAITPATATITADQSVTYTAVSYNADGASLADVTSETFFTMGGGTCTGATCNATTPGADSVVADYDGMSPTASVTVTAGAAATVTATGGGGQSAAPGQAFADPLVVAVADDHGNPVSGVTVTFSVASGPASFASDPATAVTDSQGNASAPPLTAGASPGPVTVHATVAGVSAPAVFSESVVQTDTTPPTSTVTPGPGAFPRYWPHITVTANATFADTAGTTVGTVNDVTCWDSTGIKLTLNATDPGSGVASLTYSATGAGALPSTTVSMLPVTVPVTASGLTTLSYSATDQAGNVEATQQQSVLATPGFSCTAPTPAQFAIPSHGTVTITGTVTVYGYTFPYSTTINY